MITDLGGVALVAQRLAQMGILPGLRLRVVRRYFLESPPDLVLNILDARNLYRGLGLTLQMAMSGLPMLVAVNMMDEVRTQGLELDLDVLAEHLGVAVVGISARSGEGIPNIPPVSPRWQRSAQSRAAAGLPCSVSR